jgi:hypothetical protein
VRYRANQIVDGKVSREQCTQWLCEKDGKQYRSVKDKNVKLLRDRFMLTVNESGPDAYGASRRHSWAWWEFTSPQSNPEVATHPFRHIHLGLHRANSLLISKL